MPDKAFDALAALRDADRLRYLSLLYAPADKRHALAALHGFNAEIAAIGERVTEALPGEMRLQYWRDVLGGADVDAAAAGNPLALALGGTISRYNLSKSAFANLLDARVFDLYGDLFPDRTAFEGYAGETRSILFQMAAQILNDGAVPDTADAAGHAGVAQGVAEVLRDLARNRARGRCLVPADLLSAAGIDGAGFLALDDRAAAGRAVEAFVALGREHLAKAEAAIAPLSPHLKTAFLPLTSVAPMLDHAGRVGADVLEAPIRLSSLRLQWRMLRLAMRWG